MANAIRQFGAGSRTCIGKNVSRDAWKGHDTTSDVRQVALCEIYKVIPALLRHFHMELLDPKEKWKTRNYWFNKPAKVHVRVRLRNQRYAA